MEKPPVLLIPGTLCTPEVFDGQVDAIRSFAPRADTVSFDLEASIPDMAETAMRYIHDGEGATIIGFSMGGMVAMEIARRAPQLVSGLILLNTNAHADLPGRRIARQKHLQEARDRGMANVIGRYYLDRYLLDPNPDARELITRMAVEMGVDSFAAQIEALATRPDSSEVLAGIDCPTLIIGSSDDELCPGTEQVRMHGLVKDSSLEILPDCGHFSLLEKPGLVNRVIEDWYRTS